MTQNDQQTQDALLAQANPQQEAPIVSRPMPYQYNPAEREFITDLLRSPPTPSDPSERYQLPSSINDVGGQKGNGFPDSDSAARAAAQSLHGYTARSGHEAGAWIVSTQQDGQERFFIVAPTQGVDNTIDNQTALADLQRFQRENPNTQYSVVGHIHSHPQAIRVNDQTGLIQEGPSTGDFSNWGGNNIHGISPSRGYVVSADGDVFRLDFPDLKNKSPQERGDMASGNFTQATLPTLNRIGDVDPTNDNPLTPNLWGRLTNGQPATLLPQSQVVDRVTLISDPAHPDNDMYQQALKGMDKEKITFANPQEKENAAASLVYAARRDGLEQIDYVVASKDGKNLFAGQGSPTDDLPLITRPPVDKAQASAQSVETSSERLLNDQPNFQAPKPPAANAEGVHLDQPQEVIGARSR